VPGTPTSVPSFYADVATLGALKRERHVRDLVLTTRICQSYEARGHIRDDAIAHVCATPSATTHTSTRMCGTREARGRGQLVWPAGGAGAVSSRWREGGGRGTGALVRGRPTRTATAAVAARCPCLRLVLKVGWCSAASVRHYEALVPDAPTSPSPGARLCASTSTCT
jgi:hypothetical protein